MNIASQFAWWPTVTETPPWLKESQGWCNDPLKDLDWKPLAPWAWIYWRYNWDSLPDNRNCKTEKIERQSESAEKDHEENPNYPIIQRFFEIKWIDASISDKNKINDSLVWLWELNIQELKEALETIDFDDENLWSVLLGYLWKIEELNPHQLEEDNSSQEGEVAVSLPEDFEKSGVLSDENNQIIQLLAKNYVKIPDWEDGGSNFEKDIQTCFEITVNKIINGKEFSRNQWFEIAIEEIQSWDLEAKLLALSYIHSLVNTVEWVKSKKSKEWYENMKKAHMEKKQELLDFKIWKLKKQLKSEENQDKKDQINSQIEELEKQKQVDDFKWDVFSWWELDIADKSNPNDVLNEV